MFTGMLFASRNRAALIGLINPYLRLRCTGFKVARHVIFFLLLSGFLFGCKHESKPLAEGDTPTSGTLLMSADPSFEPLVNDEINAFQALYKKASIKTEFNSESDAITDLLNNRVNEIVISRKLRPDELSFFEADKTPSQIQLGFDAVVFLVNRQNADSDFTYSQMISLLKGNISDWKELNGSSSLGKPSLIFDNNRSGIFRFVKEEILKNRGITPNAFAVMSNDSVFRYVQNDPAAIGVVGVSWISALGDSAAYHLLSKISIAGITNPDSSGDVFYRPYKASLMRREYPFIRPIYLINREQYAGLGTGFATYATSDEGQTIVERSGLIPVTQPQRVIMLRNEF